MILVDANLLVYAHVSNFPQHEAAQAWLDGCLNGTSAVGLPWESVLAFLRLTTNPRVFKQPETIERAWAQVSEWLALPNVWMPQPLENHAGILGELLHATGASANLIPDAHLAALAIGHGLTMCSTDRDFGRFPGLKWRNPLDEAA